MSDARKDSQGTRVHTVERPPGWGWPGWLAVRLLDATFHRLAYGRLHVPGLAALERY